MTSAQIHSIQKVTLRSHVIQNDWMRAGTVCLLVGALMLALFAVTGCRPREPRAAAPLMSPFPDDQVWAVAPLLNESGVSVVDTLAISDVFTNELERIHGVTALPVQRVLDGMRAMDLGRIDSPNQARALARLIGADAIVVGTVTVYDPYDPPSLGMIVELHRVARSPLAVDDIDRIRSAASDLTLNNMGPGSAPPSRAACVLDAADVGTRLALKEFAQSRTIEKTALNWERYLVVMDLYTRFVADHLVRDLIRQERTSTYRSAIQVSAARAASGP